MKCFASAAAPRLYEIDQRLADGEPLSSDDVIRLSVGFIGCNLVIDLDAPAAATTFPTTREPSTTR
jgi:hypothetical protein